MINKKNISRHKTAISRIDFSRPIQLALDSGIIRQEWTVFDYGCGRGDDIKGLKAKGLECSGWDPSYMPDGKKQKADIVNLGYVINVIEDLQERRQILADAWKLTNKALIVSARLKHESKNQELAPFKDGFVTKRGTFQKYYAQNELREWIDDELNVSSIAASTGVFIAFRDENLRQNYLVSLHRRKLIAPSVRKSEALYETNKELLDSLSRFVAERGRIPGESEFERTNELLDIFGSIKRAFAVIRRVTGSDQWNNISEERAQDLLLHLSLQRFNGRPKFKEVPTNIQLDIKAFWGSYTRACKMADELLFSAGNLEIIDQACRSAPCGKLTHDALYIHKSALDLMPSILRVYEGCAKHYVGIVEEANIIKLHRQKPKVSYLSYPDFDKVPHPALFGALVVPLREFNVKYWDWSSSENPPILHRKEEFVPQDYPYRDKFSRLTRQEEKAGLFEKPEIIGRLQQWSKVLDDKGVNLSGHQLKYSRKNKR